MLLDTDSMRVSRMIGILWFHWNRICECAPKAFLFIISHVFRFRTQRPIDGKIFAGDASPVAGASVQIVQLGRTTVVDDQGKYEFTDIPAGRYTIAVHRDGFGDVARSIVITGGAASTVDFKLQVSGIREQVTVTATGEKEAALIRSLRPFR